jgi:transitional endoplasmic reticulum ATPase
MNYPEIKFEFYKTNSVNYKSVIALFSKFDDFKTVGGLNSFSINFMALPFEINIIQYYIDIITKWKNTRILINNNISDRFKLKKFFDVYICSEFYKNAVNRETYCFIDALRGKEGWGCKYLADIHRHLPRSFSEISYYNTTRYWFEYGAMINNEVWQVHKDRILARLKESVNEMGIIYCPIFNMEKIEHYVDVLPETINPEEDEDWEFIARDADNGFSRESRIIGVRPKGLLCYWEGLGEPYKEINEENKKKNGRYVPNVNFEDIGGLGNTLIKIREVIELPMKQPKLFKELNLPPHKGILLSGPPGCGKTLIAKAIAKEVNAHFIAINGPEIVSCWVGESDRNLRDKFSEAKKFAPSIILFDEIDSIARKRIGGEYGRHDDQLVNQLLTLLDGFETNNDVMILGTTNRPELLDEAVMRPGRFDYHLIIDKPDLQGCKEILNIYIRNRPVRQNVQRGQILGKFARSFRCRYIIYSKRGGL